MEKGALPFDTALYDSLPIGVIVYEPVEDAACHTQDFRVVYANQTCERDWEPVFHGRALTGALAVKNHMLDEYALRRIALFQTQPPRPFATYIPLTGMHVHFQPAGDLPAPYAGFFLTNITDDQEQDSRVHFLRNIRQMKNNALLMRRHEDNRLEAVFASADFAKMMECSQEEALSMMDGPGFLHTTYAEDRPLVRSMLRRRVADDGGSELTIQKITAKGKPIWCNVHYAFIDDFHEHYLYCTYYNVTVLKEYEERLRSVYVSMGGAFYQDSARTLALFRVNLTRDSIEDIRGRDLYSTDVLGRSYSEFLGQRAAYYPILAERTRFLSAFDRNAMARSYLEGRVSTTRVLFSRRPSGRVCFVEFSSSLTRHPMTGDIIAFMTETECNADKVRQILLNKILARQFDMVAYLMDGRYGVVIGESANIQWGNLFPLTRSGEYSHYLKSQVLPALTGTQEQRQAAEKALSLEAVARQTRIREPYVVNIACSIDGETYYKRFDFYLFHPEAEFYIVLKSDTTEIHEEQERRNRQLRDALEEARQANSAKTAFLSSMSHEIRTPMNAIIGLDDIALKDPGVPERTRQHLEKIGVSAKHLLGLINDILDMSRIESGRMSLKSEEFSFSGFLEQINVLVSSQCQDKGLQYHCAVRGSLDDYYIGDDMKLKQVLINILGNAVKFTPAPGSVSFTVERMGQFESQSALRFTIADTGIGMDEAYIPRIFEAFSQEDATTTNRYGGSGLGMAITKNIVEMMNGSISVTSRKGEGSTFTVNVALRNSGRKATQGGEASAQDLKVLVMDGDGADLEHAKLVLEEAGIAADTCGSGAEALAAIRLRQARRDAYNLILLDAGTPEENSLDVVRKIRQIPGGGAAVILLTACCRADMEEARAAGADGFAAKPLFASSVLSEYREAAQRRASHAALPAEKAALGGSRLLLAEDNPINAEIMLELLDMKGMEAEHAENGQEAVKLFAARPAGHFQAVLMDVRMPVMDGLAAAQAIRAMDRPDAKTIPIIAMTANAFDEDVQRSLQAGMDAHLTKPVEPDRLYETLSGLIQKA